MTTLYFDRVVPGTEPVVLTIARRQLCIKLHGQVHASTYTTLDAPSLCYDYVLSDDGGALSVDLQTSILRFASHSQYLSANDVQFFRDFAELARGYAPRDPLLEVLQEVTENPEYTYRHKGLAAGVPFWALRTPDGDVLLTTTDATPLAWQVPSPPTVDAVWSWIEAAAYHLGMEAQAECAAAQRALHRLAPIVAGANKALDGTGFAQSLTTTFYDPEEHPLRPRHPAPSDGQLGVYSHAGYFVAVPTSIPPSVCELLRELGALALELDDIDAATILYGRSHTC